MPNNTSGAIAAATTSKATAKPEATMKAYIAKMEGEIKKALPSVMTPERFTRIVMSAISTTPQLAEIAPQSFLGAMMTAAQLGVEPNTPLGQAYLLPYRNKGVLECQFQLGYKGMIDLARRSGEVANIDAHVVYENDEFEYCFGLHPDLKHVPAKTNRGEAIFYYAVFTLTNGGFGFEVMSREDIEKHAKKYSKSNSSGYSPWTTNFDEMAKKTVLKKALKYAPLKSDFVRGVVADETIKKDIAPDMSEVASMEVDYVVDAETGEVLSDGKG
jgi:recombination protein RecT